MKHSAFLVGFDNNSFHPDDGEPTVYNGTNRSIAAFPTTEPLRTIRINPNERVNAVRRTSVLCHVIPFLSLVDKAEKSVQRLSSVHRSIHIDEPFVENAANCVRCDDNIDDG